MILLIRHGFIPCSSLFNFSVDLSTSAASAFLPPPSPCLTSLFVPGAWVNSASLKELRLTTVRLCNPYHLIICVNSVLTLNYIWNNVELRRTWTIFSFWFCLWGCGITVRCKIGQGQSVAKRLAKCRWLMFDTYSMREMILRCPPYLLAFVIRFRSVPNDTIVNSLFFPPPVIVFRNSLVLLDLSFHFFFLIVIK